MTPYRDNPTPAARRPARRRLACRSSKSRGAVLVLALLGGFLMIGLIGYVFNAGRHAQLRQQTQSAADATAISGAGYVARSFNTVAMNNVEISRLIAVVQMLDSVPLATEYTLEDIRATLKRIEEQRSAGVCPVELELLDRLMEHIEEYVRSEHTGLFDGLLPDLERLVHADIGDIFTSGSDDTLDELAEDLYEQERQLEEMDQFFNKGSYDVREMTFYDSEFGRGELWKAMESLDTISTATMEQLDDLTQVTAIHTGRRNMSGEGGEALAAVAPFETNLAWSRYAFDDFQDPVVRGRLPSWADDEVTNRGPYDVVFGWRGYGRNNNDNTLSGGVNSKTSGPESPWSGGPPSSPNNNYTVTSYWTYGPLRWLNSRLSARIDTPGVLHGSQFGPRVNNMSAHKLNFIWPNAVRVSEVIDPEWITDYDEATEIVEARTPKVQYTQFIQYNYYQRYEFLPYDKTLLDAIDESRQYRTLSSTESWDVIRASGGLLAPLGFTPSERTCDYIWDDGWSSAWGSTRRRSLRSMGSQEHDSVVTRLRGNSDYVVYKADGMPLEAGEPSELGVSVRFPIVRVSLRIIRYIWAGMDVGLEVAVRNPNNFGSSEDLPAPLDFDHNIMQPPADGAVGYPGDPLTFLGLAKQPNQAPMWGELFDTSAYDGHAGIAQAGVFNNHSWDLWTQMWQAQLEPVRDYDQWVQMIQGQLDLASGYEDLSVGELQELADYLESLESLAPVLLTH